MSMKELGERVEQERVRRGLSLAEAARDAGISRDTWRKIEAGASVQDPKRQKALVSLEMDDHPVTRYLSRGRGFGDSNDGETTPDHLRRLGTRNMLDLHSEAFERAVEMALTDPEGAEQLLDDTDAVTTELWRSVQSAAGSMERGVIRRLV